MELVAQGRTRFGRFEEAFRDRTRLERSEADAIDPLDPVGQADHVAQIDLFLEIDAIRRKLDAGQNDLPIAARRQRAQLPFAAFR